MTDLAIDGAGDLGAYLLEFYKQTTDSIVIVDLQGVIVSLNPAAEAYFGYQEHELLGQEIEILIPEDVREKHKALRKNYQRHLTPRPMGRGLKFRGRHKDGTLLHVDISLCPLIHLNQTLIVASIKDVYTYRRREQKIMDMYHHDPLTGVLTGSYLNEVLRSSLLANPKKPDTIALCVLDIDDFKGINDLYGHDVGNRLLTYMAQRITKSCRGTDVVGRIGGDEFVVLLRNIGNVEKIEKVIQKIHHSIGASPYKCNDATIYVSISMGVSVYPLDSEDETQLFKKADEAMYAVKNSGKNNYLLWSSMHNDRVELAAVKSEAYQFSIKKAYDRNIFSNFMSFPAFQDYLNQLELSNATERMSLILINIDNFSSINLAIGYNVGDALLQAVSTRVLDIFTNETCIFSRKSSDEFLVFFYEKTARETLKYVKTIRRALSQLFQIENKAIYITVSMGVARYPDPIAKISTLMSHAEIALQKAKSQGKNKFKFCSKSEGERVKRLQILQNDLPRVLDGGELFLYYQPQIDTNTQKIIGAEALLRWKHPIYGFISPDIFIPLLERSFLINTIGDWTLHEACKQVKLWQRHNAELTISVNVSANQLDPLYARDTYKITTSVQKALRQSGLSAECLELEITESSILNGASTKLNLQKLKQLGVHLGCDDFGVNFSSFNRLKEFPLSTIKIDKSLIEKILSKQVEFTIVEYLIKIAQDLNIRVIAEGVVRKEQIELLRALGCHLMQGYYYSKPLPAAKFERFLL